MYLVTSENLLGSEEVVSDTCSAKMRFGLRCRLSKLHLGRHESGSSEADNTHAAWADGYNVGLSEQLSSIRSRLTAAERVVEAAREMWLANDDDHNCSHEDVCPSCCLGIALAAHVAASAAETR